MEDGDGQFENMQPWKQLYVAAVLELNPDIIVGRIVDAQKAIGERALALMRINGNSGSEQQELANAHTVLDGLKRIHQPHRRGAA